MSFSLWMWNCHYYKTHIWMENVLQCMLVFVLNCRLLVKFKSGLFLVVIGTYIQVRQNLLNNYRTRIGFRRYWKIEVQMRFRSQSQFIQIVKLVPQVLLFSQRNHTIHKFIWQYIPNEHRPSIGTYVSAPTDKNLYNVPAMEMQHCKWHCCVYFVYGNN